MRRLGSYLIILLILTAYGRCVADQFGMLHTTTASCCQVTCDEISHCELSGDATNGDHSENPEHQEDSDGQDHPKPSTPSSPCQLCLILSSDSMLMDDQLEIPSPIILDITSFPASSIFCTSPEMFLGIRLCFKTPDLPFSDHPDTSTEQRSRLQRTVAKTTPVRGPSSA